MHVSEKPRKNLQRWHQLSLLWEVASYPTRAHTYVKLGLNSASLRNIMAIKNPYVLVEGSFGAGNLPGLHTRLRWANPTSQAGHPWNELVWNWCGRFPGKQRNVHILTLYPHLVPKLSMNLQEPPPLLAIPPQQNTRNYTDWPTKRNMIHFLLNKNTPSRFFLNKN